MLSRLSGFLLGIFLIFAAGCASTLVARPSPLFTPQSFGARADGKALDTLAIQKAIDAAARAHGTVVLSDGVFLSGTLFLKDNTTIQIEKDATLLGSTAVGDYQSAHRWMALLLADSVHNIKIVGPGVIDGQGGALAADAVRIKKLKEPLSRSRPDEKLRPQIIEFCHCDHVAVRDVTLRDAACWIETYDNCTDLSLDHVTVRSTAYWNNDGIDVVDCNHVSITNCDFDSADDGICLKSDSADRLCQNVSVKDCRVRSSASGFKLGTASVGGFKNITVDGLTIYNTYRTALSLEAVDGGILENVHIAKVKATHTGGAIFVRLGHRNKDNRYSTVKNITIEDLAADIPAGRPDPGYEHPGPTVPGAHNLFPSSITGLPGHPVRIVTLNNIRVTTAAGGDASKVKPITLAEIPEKAGDYPEFSMFGELPAWALYVRHADVVQLQNVQFNGTSPDYRPAVVGDDVDIFTVHDLQVLNANTATPMVLNNVTGTSLHNAPPVRP